MQRIRLAAVLAVGLPITLIHDEVVEQTELQLHVRITYPYLIWLFEMAWADTARITCSASRAPMPMGTQMANIVAGRLLGLIHIRLGVGAAILLTYFV